MVLRTLIVSTLFVAVACSESDSKATPTPDNSTISRIAFASDRTGDWDVYVMDADGQNISNLTASLGLDTYPAWSPDGSQILFQSDRDGNLEIYVMDADGSNQTRLTNDPGKALWPSWSPDGKKIAFSSDRRGKLSIWMMSPDGTDAKDFSGSLLNSRYPTWNPKGDKLAYQDDRGVWVMKHDGTEGDRIISNDVFFDDFFVGYLDWAPKGKRLAMISNHQEGTAFTRNLYTSQIDGFRFRRLYPVASGSPYDRPSWSPDGEWIAYGIQTSDGGGWDIQVVKFDTQETVRLTSSEATDTMPDWEPRGFVPVYPETFVPALP